MNAGGYYDGLIGFLDSMTAQGFLKPVHRKRLVLSDDPEKLLNLMEKTPGGYAGKWG